MGSCALDCITNTYKFDIKTVVVTIDDPGKEATQLYVSYKTLTEVKETLTGKVNFWLGTDSVPNVKKEKKKVENQNIDLSIFV